MFSNEGNTKYEKSENIRKKGLSVFGYVGEKEK